MFARLVLDPKNQLERAGRWYAREREGGAERFRTAGPKQLLSFQALPGLFDRWKCMNSPQVRVVQLPRPLHAGRPKNWDQMGQQAQTKSAGLRRFQSPRHSMCVPYMYAMYDILGSMSDSMEGTDLGGHRKNWLCPTQLIIRSLERSMGSPSGMVPLPMIFRSLVHLVHGKDQK